MEYYIEEIERGNRVKRTAAIKARDDIDSILIKQGVIPLHIPSVENDRRGKPLIMRFLYHFKLYKLWEKGISSIKRGDVLYIQFPLIEHFLFQSFLIKAIEKRGCKVVLLLHDLDSIRYMGRKKISFFELLRIMIEERTSIKYASKLVVHNTKMIEKLVGLGVKRERITDIQIFDYLITNFDENKTQRIEDADLHEIIIAGNLARHKAGYVYCLPDGCKYNLYGVNYSGQEKADVEYHGSFEPEELYQKMRGSFGLIWDGESASTCSGSYGEYLKINNPHKTSLYLASGIPVIIWKEAALAEFVINNDCGICVSSLIEIPEVLHKMSKEEYNVLKSNALEVGKRLRDGYYTQKIIEKIRNEL